MLIQEQAVEIRVLARQGVGIREIARQLGCSRNTVRRYLQEREVPRYGPRAPRPTKLDAFKPYVLSRIEAARPKWIPAVVLLREIRARGYEGGLTQLKLFINPLKDVKAPDPVVRFETAPGEQMQADFTVVRRGRDPLLAFVATLGFSRATYVRFTAGEDSATLVACLREAFAFFGGVPQHVLFDNPRTVVLDRDAYGAGHHRWNPALLELAEEYGFRPRLCRPYRARTKGKVERFNGYLKGSFLVPLAATLKAAGLHLDVAAANAHIGRWLADVANVRTHATTGERPDRRLALECTALMPLPSTTRPRLEATTALRRATPIESLQHPLSVYQALLQEARA
ncbi:MAG: IS21 family transposase [Burkholderiaceae bacterium]|nr:IS21 family transposase [Burkholderiaceae bacterium]